MILDFNIYMNKSFVNSINLKNILLNPIFMSLKYFLIKILNQHFKINYQNVINNHKSFIFINFILILEIFYFK